MASLPNIEISPLSNTRSQHQRAMPKRFEDVMVLESTGSRETAATSEDFKISLYFPILNAMISELHGRFDNKNVENDQGNRML